MTQFIYKANAPGSLMLTGEHAVLKGYPALVCAINKRIYVTLKPRKDTQFTIRSNQLGYFESSIQNLEPISQCKLIFALLAHYQAYLTNGFDLEISSDFPSIGLGSSGALVISLLSVFQHWLSGQLLPNIKLLSLAIHIIQQAQGTGSGADAAASLLGGIVYYNAQPLEFKNLNMTLPLSVIYSGIKKSTKEVVQYLKDRETHHSSLFELLYQSIGECTHLAYSALQSKDYKILGEIFNFQQSLMDALGVNTLHLQSLINILREDPGILGAKISGAGMGDCVIGLGHFEKEKYSKANHEWLDLEITQQGIFYE